MSAPNSPKTKRGANGKFLPRPLLFHLRHPNSKTNQPKFWQILSSPKNSFAKTSSTLFRHLPETLRAEHQRKMSFPFSRKISPPPRESCKEHFSLVLPSEARQWRDDSFHIGILLKMRSDFVVQREPVSMKPKIRLARSASECGGSGGIPRIQKDFPRFFRRELQSPFREKGVPCSPNIQNRSFASQSFFFRINEREAII